MSLKYKKSIVNISLISSKITSSWSKVVVRMDFTGEQIVQYAIFITSIQKVNEEFSIKCRKNHHPLYNSSPLST